MNEKMRLMLIDAGIECFKRNTGLDAKYVVKNNTMHYSDLDGKKHSGKYTQEMKEHMQQIISDAVFEEIDMNKAGGQA